jgi:hypothetical protein
MERREKNALRRRKARQQRRNVRKREERDSESEAHIEVDVAGRKESEKRTPMLASQECGKKVMVDFLTVAW